MIYHPSTYPQLWMLSIRLPDECCLINDIGTKILAVFSFGRSFAAITSNPVSFQSSRSSFPAKDDRKRCTLSTSPTFHSTRTNSSMNSIHNWKLTTQCLKKNSEFSDTVQDPRIKVKNSIQRSRYTITISEQTADCSNATAGTSVAPAEITIHSRIG